jgi:hypothetical protein
MRHCRTADLEHNTTEAVLFWSNLRAGAWKEHSRPTRGKRPTDKLMIGGQGEKRALYPPVPNSRELSLKSL